MRTGKLNIEGDITNKLSAPGLDGLYDNIMLNAFYVAINGSLSKHNMVDGIIDEFEDQSGVDTGASTYETYNATDDYYTPESEQGGIDSNTKLMLHAEGQNNGLEIIDSGNTGHVITQNGTATLSTAQKKWGSSSLLLDGNSDYLTSPDHADWDITTNWTLDLWVKHNSVGAHMHYIGQAGGGTDWVLGIKPDNTIKFEVWPGPAIDISGGAMTTGSWHHVCVVRKTGQYWGIYLNGTQVAYADDTGMATSSKVLAIGSHQAGDYLDGNLDEVRISNVVRFSANPNVGLTDTITVPTGEHTSDSNTKLLLHMNSHDVSGDGTSGNYHIPTFYGNIKINNIEQKFGNTSLELDGTGDYISFPDSADWEVFASTSENWTIDFWVKHDDHAGTEMYISHHQDGSNHWHLQHVHGTGLQLEITPAWTITGTEITDTDWHHIAMCKVANEYGLYLDGQQCSYKQDNTIVTRAGLLRIGTAEGSSEWFDGYLDEIRIQHSNYFSAAPNVGKTDTIDVPTEEYSTATPQTLNMTLISTSNVASAQPDNARIVLFEEDVDSITLNTDLKVYVSRDGGTTYSQITLADEGDYEANKQILSGSVDISGQPSGTSMKYKIETLNNKDLKIHGISELWD